MYRKVLSILVGFVFALTSVLPIVSFGEGEGADNLEVQTIIPGAEGADAVISVEPSHLSGPGQVVISITITNTNPSGEGADVLISSGVYGGAYAAKEGTPEPSDEPTAPPVPAEGAYTNVSISNEYGVAFQTTDIPAGESYTFTGVMDVTSEQIGVYLKFTVSWFNTANNASHTYELQTIITRSDTAYLKLTRTASKSRAEAGEVIVLTYTMVNTGSLTLNNIQLVDRAIAGSGNMVRPFSLTSGQSFEFKYSYTMGSESVTSKPTVTFSPEGSTASLSVTVSSLTLGLIHAQLTKEVVMGTPTPEGVPVTLYFTNNGNQRLSGLQVTDELGSRIGSSFSLAIGETRIIEHFIPTPSSIRYVVFSVTGTDATGNSFRDNTNSYTVRPYINPELLGLNFTAQIRTRLDNDNIIGLTFKVVNTGSLDFTDVVLKEQLLDYELHKIERLQPSADGVSFDLDINVGGERELVFILTAVDPAGASHEYEIYITAEYYDPAGAVPDNPPDAGGNVTIVDDYNLGSKLDDLLTKTGESLTKWYRVLSIVAIVAAVAIVALVCIEFTQRRKKKHQSNG